MTVTRSTPVEVDSGVMTYSEQRRLDRAPNPPIYHRFRFTTQTRGRHLYR